MCVAKVVNAIVAEGRSPSAVIRGGVTNSYINGLCPSTRGWQKQSCTQNMCKPNQCLGLFHMLSLRFWPSAIMGSRHLTLWPH